MIKNNVSEPIDMQRLTEFYVDAQGKICDRSSERRYESTCTLVLMIHYLKRDFPPDLIFELIQQNCKEEPEVIRAIYSELMSGLRKETKSVNNLGGRK